MTQEPDDEEGRERDRQRIRLLEQEVARLKAEGVEAVVFGDIYLEDLRAYRDRLLAHAGLEGAYPLWGRDTGELYDEFVALRFRALTVCVDAERLTEDHLGRPLDPAFRRVARDQHGVDGADQHASQSGPSPASCSAS